LFWPLLIEKQTDKTDNTDCPSKSTDTIKEPKLYQSRIENIDTLTAPAEETN
jgi:hypothetical protein